MEQDEAPDEKFNNGRSPIMASNDTGELHIQLAGSHTTSTETECPLGMEKKNVKFQDEKPNADEDFAREKKTNEGLLKINLSEVLITENSKSDFRDSEAAIERNLESFCTSNTCYKPLNAKKYEETNLKREDIEITELRNVATNTTKSVATSTSTTICDCQSIGCQTQMFDQISLNTLSLLEVTSLTSKSEPPNSLNNYVQAENACVPYYDPQQDNIKHFLEEQSMQETLTNPPAAIQEPPATTPFSIITIEANSRPSSADLRRPPLSVRAWELLCNFCAATILCFQVNRDCIFCLGFFAAFVVSASFLTAFFYHTLVMSPALWQSEENPQV